VPEPIHFEEYALDLERYELRRAGHVLKLERIPMELLILLLESDGKLVRREVINRRLWGERAFQNTEHSVNTAVNKLRYILRDDPRAPRFIQTVVGQGYRFIAKVGAESLLGDPIVVAAADHQEPPASPSEEPIVLQKSVAEAVAPPHSVSRRRIAFFSVVAFLAAASILFLVHYWSRAQEPPGTPLSYKSVAVLPFVNLAQSSEQDYIVDGMTDQLITHLAGGASLRVISRSSVMHYKGSQIPIDQIARELHVDAILEGSFLHNGKQVRITANLIDAGKDRHLWAQVYEQSGDDLLEMQETVTNDIAREVGLALGSPLSPSRLRPVNVKARDFYFRGRSLWNKRTLDDVNRSIAYYQQAIQADPQYAEAYAALGDAYVLLSSYGENGPANSLEKAEAAAQRALQFGGGMAEAHTVLGAVKTDRDWDWDGAEAEYRRALELNPSYPTARHWYSLHLSRLGRMQEAEAEIQRARALDPFSMIIKTDAAETSYWARKPDEALERVKEVLASDPYFAEAHRVMGKISEQQGQYDKALSEFKIALALFGGGPNIKALQAHALALAGASEQATEMAHELEAASTHMYVSGVDIAGIYCGLGRTEPAMHWFDRAYLNRDKAMDMVGIDPLFDGCRNDPRFQDLIKKLRLDHAV
jgi:TolB-like protein/DNA-binding winged helix-turn-helix (wHTH) protein/Flp pilus assembly protein TadD